MRIAISSHSEAVTRTLTAIIEASGHHVAAAEEAGLIIEDAAHPAPPVPLAVERLVLTADMPTHPTALARVLMRYRLRSAQHTALGEWVLDSTSRLLTHPAMPPVTLTEKEALLLATLAEHHPRAATRETLLHHVWGLNATIDTHTLETHIYRLRSKLEGLVPPVPDIVTVEGAYKLGA
jgi:hypothetical protein